MRQVNRYCSETQINVVTGADIFPALGYDGGVANTVAERITIHRTGPSVSVRISALNQGSFGRVVLDVRMRFLILMCQKMSSRLLCINMLEETRYFGNLRDAGRSDEASTMVHL